MSTEIELTDARPIAPAAPRSPEAPLLAMLSNPSALELLDVDKVQRLIEMQERMEDRQAQKALSAALVQFRDGLPAIYKGRKTNNSTYANLDDVMEAIGETMTKCALVPSYDISERDGKVYATCHILHVDGARITGTGAGVPTDAANRGMNAAQAAATATTYAKRNAINAVLALSYTDKDDDAVSTSAATVTDEQGDQILALLKKFPAWEEEKLKLFKWLKISSISEVPAARFGEVMAGYTKKLAGYKAS